MMDLSDKVSDHDLLFNGGSGSESTSGKKICSDCKTSKTPLWRVGPNGPKTLCNACGIKYRKQRGTSLNKVGAEKKRKEKRNEMSWKLRFMDVGEEVFSKRSKRSKRSKSSNLDKQRKWGEVEQAAVLLMALSCGSVYC